MRINVYSQELTRDVSLVETEAEGFTYYGVRMFLASPDVLHHTPEDDDRSAVTFWLPNSETMTKRDLARVFFRMAAMCDTAPEPSRND